MEPPEYHIIAVNIAVESHEDHNLLASELEEFLKILCQGLSYRLGLKASDVKYEFAGK